MLFVRNSSPPYTSRSRDYTTPSVPPLAQKDAGAPVFARPLLAYRITPTF